MKISSLYSLIYHFSLLLAASLIFVGIYQGFLQRVGLTFFSKATAQGAIENNSVNNLQPITVEIEKINLRLPVSPIIIKNDKWQISQQGISWLQNYQELGISTPLVLYGHNWANLLSKLSKTVINDQVKVIYSDTSSDLFQIKQILKVAPSDISILKTVSEDSLVIYTCIGLLDSQRLIIIASKLE